MSPPRFILERLGARLKLLRRERDLRVRQVAEVVGIARGTLYAIEGGRKPPSLTLLLDLAALYQLDAADLMTWADTHVRHDVRELVRLTPPGKLPALHAAWLHARARRKEKIG